MKAPRSLEITLLLRLGVVLIAAFTAIAIWLWLHLGHIEAEHPQPIVHDVMAEFFTDIAWVVPVVRAPRWHSRRSRCAAALHHCMPFRRERPKYALAPSISASPKLICPPR